MPTNRLPMLLDTNVLIWMFTDFERLGNKARQAIANAEDLYVSVVSQYEVAIKQRLGHFDVLDQLEQELVRQEITQIPLKFGQFKQLVSLKQVAHRDPFDLLIVSLAIKRKVILVTADRILLSMNVPGLMTLDARK